MTEEIILLNEDFKKLINLISKIEKNQSSDDIKLMINKLGYIEEMIIVKA